MSSNKVIYVIGVSGAGKSTIGSILAEKLAIPFYDGDDFHSGDNKAKMSSGKALTDEDRKDWLTSINHHVREILQETSLVVACSALKEGYRSKLRKTIEDRVLWVYLKGSHELIASRVSLRKKHFMPLALLKSQFDILEEPRDAMIVSVESEPSEIVDQVISRFTSY